jgi:hypothetical protein
VDCGGCKGVTNGLLGRFVFLFLGVAHESVTSGKFFCLEFVGVCARTNHEHLISSRDPRPIRVCQ